MKLKLITIFAMGLLLAACSKKADTQHQEAPTVEQSHDDDGHDDLIELPDDRAARMGVKVDTVMPGEFAYTIKAAGVIERTASESGTASAPIAGTVQLSPGVTPGAKVAKGAVLARINPNAVSGSNPNVAARAAIDAAQREVNRLKPLLDERLVTIKEYNDALEKLELAKAQLQSVSVPVRTVVAPIAGTVTALNVADGSFVNPGDAVATVSADSELTLRAEVPAEYYPQLEQVTDARINGDFLLGAHGGRKGGISSANGYGSVWFTFRNDGTVMPGSGVEVWLLGSPRQGVVSVPADAVIEQQGEHYVFLRHSPGHYVKLPVSLGAADGSRVEITSGLKGGEPVVTAGAMTVHLAESSGTVPEGHSHSH